jgi:hypothetical protein
MKKLIVLYLILFTTAVAFAQQMEADTLHLKNDSIVYGKIVKQTATKLWREGTEGGKTYIYIVPKKEIKEDIFSKRMYLGINGTCDIFPLFKYRGGPHANLEFERQFSKHWGYTAGLGAFYLMYQQLSDNPLAPGHEHSATDIYLEMPVGMKFYSKILNVSMGINVQRHLRRFHFCNIGCTPYPYQFWLDPWMFGTYLTISKDFTVCRNFKIEPYIQGYLLMVVPHTFLYPAVGLRLKYEFHKK